MPYISGEAIERLHNVNNKPLNKGELNYLISCLLIEYINNHGKCYKVISDAIGAATDAAEECRRRVLNPYEDKKATENIDIYIGIIQ